MKLAAFTLFEMIIAMALLGIVIALVYSSVTMAGGRAQQYSKSANEHLNLLAFTQHLEEDLAQSSYVLWDNQQGFTIVNYDTSEVRYFKDKGYLFREKEFLTDSLAVGQIEANSLQLATPDSEPLLRELWIETKLFGQTLQLYFFKEYYASNQLLVR